MRYSTALLALLADSVFSQSCDADSDSDSGPAPGDDGTYTISAPGIKAQVL